MDESVPRLNVGTMSTGSEKPMASASRELWPWNSRGISPTSIPYQVPAWVSHGAVEFGEHHGQTRGICSTDCRRFGSGLCDQQPVDPHGNCDMLWWSEPCCRGDDLRSELVDSRKTLWILCISPRKMSLWHSGILFLTRSWSPVALIMTNQILSETCRGQHGQR